ncbi:MAG: tetratricopeptide repeat protein, partial [Bacteroidia bacterium]|nr:tetratricopeptide repeat protein [Bacteroidia bacterium]
YINNPEIVDEFYEAINMGELNFQDCQECVNRMYLKALADIEKEEYYKVIDLLEEKALLTNNFWLLRPLIMAYVRTNSFESLEKVLNRLKLMGSTDWEEANTVAGKEILRFYEPDQAMKYFQAVKENSPDKESQRYARSLYYMQDYKQAEPLLKAIIDKEPDGFRNRAYHAISLYKNNKTDEAKAAIKALNEMRKELQFGAIDYAIAQFYASIGEKDIALEHLMNSIANGNYYSPETFQNDYHLRDLVDLPEFNLIMNFWNN